MSWQFDHRWWNTESAGMRRSIFNLPWQSQRELNTLIMVLDDKVFGIAKEEIICRRQGKQTDRHRQLMSQFWRLHEGFIEQRTLAALLM